MALESPLKKDIDFATRQLDAMQRLYNVYFQGGEEDPPRKERKDLDTLIFKIKSQMITATNAADKFLATSLINRFQSMSSRWDRHLRGIENGTIAVPKKRD